MPELLLTQEEIRHLAYLCVLRYGDLGDRVEHCVDAKKLLALIGEKQEVWRIYEKIRGY
jgi:hypothetical protein